ncbi:MAG TPA: hypothetical protein VGH63_00185 [Polyangia bacterium]|jgi:hypothetical protein
MNLLRCCVLLALAGCHGWRSDRDRAVSPAEYCLVCCAQARDACKMDSDHTGYYCPRDYQECVNACADNNENQMCVVETNRKFAATAPKPIAATAAEAKVTTAQRVTPPDAHGECDVKGTWSLTIDDASGHGNGCGALDKVPRDLTFRIESKHSEYALRDLAPQPGWDDRFHVDNRADQCGVVLTRDNRSDGERPRTMTIELTERGGAVTGIFRYVETMPKPALCELEAKVRGKVAAPAPQAAPPQTAPVQPPPRLQMTTTPPRR